MFRVEHIFTFSNSWRQDLILKKIHNTMESYNLLTLRLRFYSLFSVKLSLHSFITPLLSLSKKKKRKVLDLTEMRNLNILCVLHTTNLRICNLCLTNPDRGLTWWIWTNENPNKGLTITSLKSTQSPFIITFCKMVRLPMIHLWPHWSQISSNSFYLKFRVY